MDEPNLDPTRVRVLVVEDDQDLLESESRLLTRAGYTVLPAADGEEALRLLESGPVDVVLTDLRLPGISGIEVLCAVREKSPQVRVFLITAYVEDSVRQEGMRLGASGFLTKPITRTSLLAAIGPPIRSP